MSTVEYDIVIAGGGTAGGIIAGRLSAADPALKILVLEAGPHTLEDPMHVQPARYLSHLAPDSVTVRFYAGEPSENVGGRSVVVPTGACIGGGSSVNFQMYTRPAASDYDDWETKFGNSGWASRDLLPLIKKAETYQIPESDNANPRDTHGFSGPLKVSYGGAYTNIGREFLDVAAGYDKARGAIADPNSLFDVDGYGRWQKWIDGKTGKRSDVPHHYLYPQTANPNLHIITGAVVNRVTFEGTRATGVEWTFNARIRPETDSATVNTAIAKKLVVVSSGTFGTPQVLERSGVGAKKVLDAVGVEQVVDLPGVGECYQDHMKVFAPYIADENAETLDAIIRNDTEEIEKWNTLWHKEGCSGLMAHNGLDSAGKLRPTAEELKLLGPGFEPRWKEYFENAPDKPVMWLGPVSFSVDPGTAVGQKYFCVGYFVEYPVSLGSIHIKTATDVLADPRFDTGFMSDPSDMAILKWGYKRSREFARRMPSYRGEFVPGHPTFAEGSQVVASDAHRPVPLDTEDLVFTAADDAAIEKYTRDVVSTAWHSLGTSAMKPRDKGGVVDSRLNVYGTQNLKVADMSIAPSNVSANTYSTAVVIGRRLQC